MKTSGAPGLGHNQGPPLDPAERWRRHCWKAAKRALFRPLPIETVRRRVKRAAEIGLAYRRYELLVLGGGEVRAMLIAEDSLVITAPYASPAATPEQGALRKFAAVTGCRRLLLAEPGGLQPVWALPATAGPLFEATIRVPLELLLAAPPVKADRAALADGLRGSALPVGSVALVGDGAHGTTWVAGARLAGLVPASEYFAT